jgi:hypothetical protein
MKLTETIDECIKFAIEEIECYDFYISEYENKCPNYVIDLKDLKDGKKTWLEHLQNLKYIKYETQLEEYDELIERDE